MRSGLVQIRLSYRDQNLHSVSLSIASRLSPSQRTHLCLELHVPVASTLRFHYCDRYPDWNDKFLIPSAPELRSLVQARIHVPA
jgi:hypothetical protein